MTKHKELQKAIRQMAEGSKSAFRTFYLGSAQFVYSSARLLYGDHAAACRFMVDYYQYLYLHLPEYNQSQNLETWISRLVMERFSQLSIGKHTEKPSVQSQMSAGTAVLEMAERERVWRLLEERMHFPREDPKKRGGRRMLLVPALLLAVLLAFHYREPILEKLQTALTQEHSDEENDENKEDAEGTGDPEYEDAENDENGMSDDMGGNPDAKDPDPNDNVTSLINNNDGGGLQTPEGQTSAPKAPTVDTPTVDTPSPTAPNIDKPTTDTPTAGRPTVNSPISEQDGGLSGFGGNGATDLENYELGSYYGDSLAQ